MTSGRNRGTRAIGIIGVCMCLNIGMSDVASAQDARYLYAPLAAGQVLDWHSTRTALARPGTQEMNALLQTCVKSDSCFLGFKGAMTAGIIASMEVVRKKHPKAAFWTTFGITAGMTGVALHNYRRGR